MKLSFLVPAIQERWETGIPAGVQSLWRQCEHEPEAEVLILLDNKEMILGAKRNRLFEMASGEWIMYVDDDDRVHSNIVQILLEQIDVAGRDVVVLPFMIQLTDIVKMQEVVCYYTLETTNCRYLSNQLWRGHPSHTMPWRKSFAEQVKFPEKNWQEDVGWSKPLTELAQKQDKQQLFIQEILYWYDLDRRKSATRGQ